MPILQSHQALRTTRTHTQNTHTNTHTHTHTHTDTHTQSIHTQKCIHTESTLKTTQQAALSIPQHHHSFQSLNASVLSETKTRHRVGYCLSLCGDMSVCW